MSHPLLVEAIETSFVPLLIHNNKSGYDAQILKQFNEPSWNNPVVRYLDSNGKDVIARRDGVWTTGGTAERMVMALKAARKKVPNYLVLAALENAQGAEYATFAMHCYWEGEVKLGGIAGVRETSAGWIGGKEVVNVAFNPKVVSYEKLLKTAQSMQCASTVFAHNSKQTATAKKLVRDVVDLPSASRQRPVRYTEQKYHLRRTALKYLPLTPIQLAKVNSAVYARKDYRQYLSPRQIELDKQINAALRADSKKLQGLAAPDAAKDLPAYSKKLMARLK